MNDNSSTSAGRSASHPKDPPRRANHQKQKYVFVNQQAATMNAGKSNSTVTSGRSGAKSAGHSRPYPTPRLSHLQPAAASAPNLASLGFDKLSAADRARYHEAISQSTQSRFDEELAKAFQAPFTGQSHHVTSPIHQLPAQPQSKKPDLAATHSTQYGSTSKPNHPSTSPDFMRSARRDSLSPMHGQSPPPAPKLNQPQVSPPYTDPMHQTSTTIPEWSRNRTVLKADVNIEYGNAISPTWMIGPFLIIISLLDKY